MLQPRTLAVVLLAVLAAPATAQRGAVASVAAPAVSARDSARLQRAARAEQARFESVRRNHLPWAWGGGGGECDERIGRFCLTHGGDDTSWEPDPEAEEIVRARERLIDHLRDAAAVMPGDPWIVGQRVRYLVEAKRFGEAMDAARACRAEAWWCHALAGFAEHYAGRAPAADSAFERMLPRMPADERARWTDLSVLLDGCTLRAYRKAGAAGKDAFEARFWRLADPLHSRPGNEVRSEHFARNVWDHLQERAKSTEGISWGDDLREILLRYGWPQGWERVRPSPGEIGRPGLVSHYADSDRDLTPPCEALADGGEIHLGEWDAQPRAPRTGYALASPDSAYQWIAPLDYQLAVFRRGDSAVVVAAYRMPADSLPAGARVEAELALLQTDAPPTVATFPHADASGATLAHVPTGPLLVSVEAVAPNARRVSRVRYGIHVPPMVPGLLAVSDLMLLATPDALPDSLAPAARDVRRSTRVRPGERMGVYWEIYGLGAGQPDALTMTLRLVEEGEGWAKRLARRIGLVERIPPVRVRWQERAGAAPVLARSLAVQIPDDLAPGSYALELSVGLPGREPLLVRRLVRVE